jgi:hypothetical protein
MTRRDTCPHCEAFLVDERTGDLPPIDIDAYLASLPAEFDDPGDNPWGTANHPCTGPDLCDLCRWLETADDAPTLRAAFEKPRRFEPCNGSCCRDEQGLLTEPASKTVLEEFDHDFPEAQNA